MHGKLCAKGLQENDDRKEREDTGQQGKKNPKKAAAEATKGTKAAKTAWHAIPHSFLATELHAVSVVILRVGPVLNAYTTYCFASIILRPRDVYGPA